MGNYRFNILKLASDSVVKNFFITAEEISVVCEDRRPIEEVSVCKESLPTVSTCAEIAQVQKDGIFKKVRQRWTFSNGRSSFVSENDCQKDGQNAFVSKNDTKKDAQGSFVSENDSQNDGQNAFGSENDSKKTTIKT